MGPICQIDSMSSLIRYNGDSLLTYTVYRTHDPRRASKWRAISFVFFKVIKLWTALNVQLGTSPTRVASPVGDDSTLVSGEPCSSGTAISLDETVISWKLVFVKFDRGSGTHTLRRGDMGGLPTCGRWRARTNECACRIGLNYEPGG